jgi:hypothetical protein
VEVRFSAPVQTGSEAKPASYTVGTVSFREVKQTGLDVNHPPQSRAEVKKRVFIPLLPLWAFVACSRMTFTFTFTEWAPWYAEICRIITDLLGVYILVHVKLVLYVNLYTLTTSLELHGLSQGELQLLSIENLSVRLFN